MTLPNEKVLELLKRDFVVGWNNIEREEFCGTSSGYSRRQSAIGTTNGAGAHNVQMFVLSADGVVLHALPGFWHPDDLTAELRFAQVIDRLWRDQTRSRQEKECLFEKLHDLELRKQSEITTARSDWQSFDASAELRRVAKNEVRDTVVHKATGKVAMKPLNVLVHERMAARPFVPFAEFDTASFVDYGLRHYDNNRRVDSTGRRFVKQERLMMKRNRERQRDERRARVRRKTKRQS